MRVAIIGGGIAGLTAVLCLRQNGFEPILFEQADAFSEIGAGLQLGPNAVKVFRALGLEDALMDIADLPSALTLKSGYSGQDIFSLPLGDIGQERWGAPYVHCHRADLISLLAAAVHERGIACHFGAAVTRVDGKIIRTQNDIDVRADVIVLAGGIRSTISGLDIDLPAPKFAGSAAWRAAVPMAALGRHAPPRAAIIWTGRGCHAVTYPLRGGTLLNIVGVVDTQQQSNENWVQTGTHEQALSDFRGFHPTVLKALRSANTLYKWGIYERALPKRWGAAQSVVIGDACHAMPPYLAQGAAMAIEDAWALAQCLAQSDTRVDALEAFQLLREPRVKRVMSGAQQNRERFHLSSLAQRVSAFGLLKAADTLAQTQMLKQLDWLYGYDVIAQ